ncbi:hypothetical protein SMICM304S_00836 [Streptomyces microflavus]
MTASARSAMTLPERGRISTVPRPSAAVRVTRVWITRFSAYVPGRTLMSAPVRAAASASPIVEKRSPGPTDSTWRDTHQPPCYGGVFDDALSARGRAAVRRCHHAPSRRVRYPGAPPAVPGSSGQTLHFWLSRPVHSHRIR